MLTFLLTVKQQLKFSLDGKALENTFSIEQYQVQIRFLPESEYKMPCSYSNKSVGVLDQLVNTYEFHRVASRRTSTVPRNHSSLESIHSSLKSISWISGLQSRKSRKSVGNSFVLLTTCKILVCALLTTVDRKWIGVDFTKKTRVWGSYFVNCVSRLPTVCSHQVPVFAFII